MPTSSAELQNKKRQSYRISFFATEIPLLWPLNMNIEREATT